MLQKSIFILLLSFTLNASETVICIHGFHGAPWNMYLLEKNFNRRGFNVTNWGYPSSDKTIESHGQDLVSTLQKIALDKPGAPMSFVTHSMGGLVLRSALNHPQCPEEAKKGKVVMIAPPNNGSSYARFLSQFSLVRLIGKDKSGKQLLESNNFDFLGKLPSSLEDVLVISGTRGYNPFIEGENDGTVGHKETCLTTPHKHIKLPSGHISILFNKDTFIEAHKFLKRKIRN